MASAGVDFIFRLATSKEKKEVSEQAAVPPVEFRPLPPFSELLRCAFWETTKFPGRRYVFTVEDGVERYDYQLGDGKASGQPKFNASRTGQFDFNTFARCHHTGGNWRPILEDGTPRQWPDAVASTTEPDVEFRPGCPSVAHVEAALRLGLEWSYRDRPHNRYRLVVLKDQVHLDCAPFCNDEAMLLSYSRFCQAGDDNADHVRVWRPRKVDGTPVSWQSLDAEVVRHAKTQQTASTLSATPPLRHAVGDVVTCSSFQDGEAGVRVETIAARATVQRNLGRGEVVGSWQKHDRYNVRSFATGEVHTWPAGALVTAEKFAVGDEVVTSRFDGRPMFVPSMEEHVGKRGRITSKRAGFVMVHGWEWPLDALTRSWPGEDGTKPKAATRNTPVRHRVPTVEEIDAHDKAHGGRWRRQSKLCQNMSIWLDDGVAKAWVSDTFDRSGGWNVEERRAQPGWWDGLQPIDADGNVVAWPLVTPKLENFSGNTTISMSSRLPRDGDAMTVDSHIAVAEEGARRALKSLLQEQGVTDITIQQDKHGTLSATYTITPKPFAHDITLPLHITQENTHMATNTPTTTSTAATSTQPSLIDELKEDAHELGYRLAASETVEITRDVLVDLLTAEVAEREQSLAKDYAREMLSSKAGLALVGLAASFGLPAVAKAVDRGDDPRVLRLARECRREGAMPGLKLLAGKLRALLVGAGSRLLGVFDKLPAESGSMEVVEHKDGTCALPGANASPDFGVGLGTSARCRTTA